MNEFHKNLYGIFARIHPQLSLHEQTKLFDQFTEIFMTRFEKFDDPVRIEKIRNEVAILRRIKDVNVVTRNFAMFDEFDDFSFAYFLFARLAAKNGILKIDATMHSMVLFSEKYPNVVIGIEK